MSILNLIEETVDPSTPSAGRGKIYAKDGKLHYVNSSGLVAEYDDVASAITAHEGLADPHPGYLTETEADLLYPDINHDHECACQLRVTKSGMPGTYLTIADALTAANALVPSTTNRVQIIVLPGEYTESPFTIPAYVYVLGNDPWGAAHIKTDNNSADFITVSPNAGLFNLRISGPTGTGYSAIVQTASGTTKLYWLNIAAGYYGITLKPASSTARCHCVGVVTDGATMNRMFNCDNPAGYGVFILMQSGPMVTTWTGTNPAAVYVNSDGLSPPRASATLDLCQFRGNAPSGQTLYDVYADNGALVRGISCSFAGATSLTNPRIALCSGPNPGTTYKTKIDIHGSQIKPGNYTKDIKIMHADTLNSYSGTATEANLDFVVGAQFNGSFADPSFGQVIYGELFVGNTYNKTPLSSYVEADKSTGVQTGGGLSRGAGARQVDVASGIGFLDTANGLKRVEWNATTITVNASVEKARIYVDDTGTIQQSAVGINKELNIQLGEVGTDADSVTYIFDQKVTLPHFRQRLYEYLEKVIGPINIDGGIVTENATDLHLDVTDSTYFVTEEENNTVGDTDITFNYWYRTNTGGWVAVENQSVIDTGYYDDGSGTLAALPAGKFKRDLLMVGVNSGATEYHVIYGQTLFDTGGAALTNPIVPAVFTEHACRLSAIIVEQGGTAIHTLEDQRPRLGQAAAGTGSITNHNDLTGRDSSTAHTQYQLGSEKGAANGYASLDASAQVPVNQLGNVTHGTQSGGTLHSEATTSVAGFMSATDKTKLNGVATGATANATDAQLRDRTTHTGEQAISTVTGLQAALDSKITGDRQVVVLGSNQASTSTTLVDVTGVSVPVVAGTYVIKAHIAFQSTSTTSGVAFSLNGPTTSLVAMTKRIPTSATAATIQNSNAFTTLQATASVGAANTTYYADLEALITFTASGTLILRQASELGGAQSVTTLAGTTMFAEKVA